MRVAQVDAPMVIVVCRDHAAAGKLGVAEPAKGLGLKLRRIGDRRMMQGEGVRLQAGVHLASNEEYAASKVADAGKLEGQSMHLGDGFGMLEDFEQLAVLSGKPKALGNADPGMAVVDLVN